MTTSNSAVRYDNLDLLKCIAIFFVVIYHFNNMPNEVIHPNSAMMLVNYYLKTIFSCCVPLFFVVNGALLMNKELHVRRHAIKTLKIVAITFVWGAITLFALMFVKEKLSLTQFFNGLWTWKLGWINHLWFLQALVVVYLFVPLIVVAFRGNRAAFYFFFAVVGVLTFGNTFILYCTNTIAYFADQKLLSRTFNFFNNFHALRGIYGYTIGYFMLGGVLFANKEWLDRQSLRRLSVVVIPLAMLLLCCYGVLLSVKNKAVTDVVWCGYDSIFTVINVVALFILTLHYTHRGVLGMIIKTVGANSLGIYFLHRIFGFIFKPFFVVLSFSTSISTSIFASILFALFLLFLSLGVCLLLKRVPVVKWLFAL